MEPQSLHFQSQAVAMLAMATGAIGFGLFGEEFPVSMELLPTMKLVAGGYALVATCCWSDQSGTSWRVTT